MKNIKVFEEYLNIDLPEPLYKIGDYIFVRQQISKNKVYKGTAKIVDIEYVDILKKYQYITTNGISNKEQIGDTDCYFSGLKCYLEDQIKRKSTPEEIEDFDKLTKLKKYNL